MRNKKEEEEKESCELSFRILQRRTQLGGLLVVVSLFFFL